MIPGGKVGWSLKTLVFLICTTLRGGDGGVGGGGDVGSGASSSEKDPISLRTSQSERLGMKSSSSDSGSPGGVGGSSGDGHWS